MGMNWGLLGCRVTGNISLHTKNLSRKYTLCELGKSLRSGKSFYLKKIIILVNIVALQIAHKSCGVSVHIANSTM